MKKANLLFLTIIGLTFLTSCTGNKDAAKTDAESTIMSVDDVLISAEIETDKVVAVGGMCTHICAHGGQKIFLMGEDDSKIIRIESTDDLGAFKPECVGAMVNVTGILKEERIDEAYLVKWESESADGTAEEHGEDGEGCETEQKAQGQDSVSSVAEQIQDFRTRIAERNAADGKDYLSFYYIEAYEYTIL